MTDVPSPEMSTKSTELPAEFDQVFKAVPGIGEIVRIADAGHWVQYEEAQRFNGELVRLLGK